MSDLTAFFLSFLSFFGGEEPAPTTQDTGGIIIINPKKPSQSEPVELRTMDTGGIIIIKPKETN